MISIFPYCSLSFCFEDNKALWVPYGFHVMHVGLAEANCVLYVPMVYDKLLQGLPAEVHVGADLNVRQAGDALLGRKRRLGCCRGQALKLGGEITPAEMI